jgi:hypothetical protein
MLREELETKLGKAIPDKQWQVYSKLPADAAEKLLGIWLRQQAIVRPMCHLPFAEDTAKLSP